MKWAVLDLNQWLLPCEVNFAQTCNVLICAHLHNIQHLMQPIKIRQFRQKAQNQRQFGRGMVAKFPFLPAFLVVIVGKK